MSIYWIEFKNRTAACLVTPASEDELAALVLAKAHGEPKAAHRLPYPREPLLIPREPNACPAFCYGGRECLGKTSCPQRRSCCD